MCARWAGRPATQIALLPDKPARHSVGFCLIAPELSKVDLDRALAMLEPKEGSPVRPETLLALARILRDLSGAEPLPGEPAWYPERMDPRWDWPGPYLSDSLRF